MMQKSKTTWCNDRLPEEDGRQLRASPGQKIQRLVQWNNELLLQLLKQVVTRRHSTEDGIVCLILWHLTLDEATHEKTTKTPTTFVTVGEP
jgi:hypothetical protein